MNTTNNPLLNRYYSDCFALQLWVRALQEPHSGWLYDASCEKLVGPATPKYKEMLPVTALFSIEKKVEQPLQPSLLQWLPNRLKHLGKTFELFAETTAKTPDVQTLERLLKPVWLKDAIDSGITPLKALRQFPLGHAQKEVLQACLDRVQSGLQEVESVPHLSALVGNELKDLEKQLTQMIKKPALEPVRESINSWIYSLERVMSYYESRLKTPLSMDDMAMLMAGLPFLHHLLSSCPTFVSLNATTQCLRYTGFHVVLTYLLDTPAESEGALKEMVVRSLESLSHHLNLNMGFDLPFPLLLKQGLALFVTMHRKVESHQGLDSMTQDSWKQTILHYHSLLEPLPKTALERFKAGLRDNILHLYRLGEAGDEQAGWVFYQLSLQLQTLSVKGEMIDYHLLQISHMLQQELFDPEKFAPFAIKRLRWILSQLKEDIAKDRLESACQLISHILNALDNHQLSRMKAYLFQILPLMFSSDICHKLMDVASRNLTAGQQVVFVSLLGKAVSSIPEEISSIIDEDLAKRPRTPDHSLNTPYFRNALAHHARRYLLEMTPTVMKRLRNALSLPTRGYPLILNALGIPEGPLDTTFEEILAKATLTLAVFSETHEKEVALTYWHHRLSLALFHTLFKESSDEMRLRLVQTLPVLAVFTVSSLLMPRYGGEVLFRQLAALLKDDTELSLRYAEKMSAKVETFSDDQKTQFMAYFEDLLPSLCASEQPFALHLHNALTGQVQTSSAAPALSVDTMITHLVDPILGSQDLHPCRTVLRFIHTLFLSMEWVQEGEYRVMSPALHLKLDRYLKDHCDSFYKEVPKSLRTLLDHYIHLEKNHIPTQTHHEADLLLTQDYKACHLTPEEHLFARLVILLIRSKSETEALAQLMVLWGHHLGSLPDILSLLEPIMTPGFETLFFNAMSELLTPEDQWIMLYRLIPSAQEFAKMAQLTPFVTAWFKQVYGLLDLPNPPYAALRQCIAQLILRLTPLVQLYADDPTNKWLAQYQQILERLLITGTLQLSDLTAADCLTPDHHLTFTRWTEVWTDMLHFLRGQIVIDPTLLTPTQAETLTDFLANYSHFIYSLRYQDGGLYLRCVAWLISIYHHFVKHPPTQLAQKRLMSQLSTVNDALLTPPLLISEEITLTTLMALYNTQYHAHCADQLESAFFDTATLEEQTAFLSMMTATPMLLQGLLMRTQGPVHSHHKKKVLIKILHTQFADMPDATEMANLLYKALLELTSKRFHDFTLFKDHAFSLLKNARVGRHYHLILQQLSRIILGYKDALLSRKIATAAQLEAISSAAPTEIHLSLMDVTNQLATALKATNPPEALLLEEGLASLVVAFLFMYLHYGIDFETPSDTLLQRVIPLVIDCQLSQFEALSDSIYEVMHVEECRPLHRLLELSIQLGTLEERWELLCPLLQQLSLFTLTKRQETMTIFYLLHDYGLSFDQQASLLPTLDAKREFLDILYSHHSDLGLFVSTQLDLAYETLPFVRRKAFQAQGNLQDSDLPFVLWFTQGTPGYSALLQFLTDSLHVTTQALHVDSFAVPTSAYLQDKTLPKSAKSLLAAKAKCSLVKLLTQYSASPTPQATQPLIDFFEGLFSKTDEDLEAFLPFVLLRQNSAFFRLLQEQHHRLHSRLLDYFFDRTVEFKGKTPFLVSLHLLMHNEAFKRDILSEFQSRYEKQTLSLAALPTQLVIEALTQRVIPLQAIQTPELLSDAVRLLYSREQEALIDDAVADIFPKLTEAMETSFFRNNRLLLEQTLRLMNATSLQAPEALEAFFSHVINTHKSTRAPILERLFSHPLFLASHPNRDTYLKTLFSSMFTRAKDRAELTETLLQVIQKSHHPQADLQLPQDLLQSLQEHLISGKTTLTLPELLASLEVLSSLPHPFDPTHLATLQEGFLDIEKAEFLAAFSEKAPSLFRELLLIPGITQTLYPFLQIGYNPATNAIKDAAVKEIRHFSKYESSQFLKQYISETKFGKEIHTQVEAVIDQLLPQLDPSAYPEAAQKALILPLDKVGNIDTAFVGERILSYVNLPYVLLDPKDPFFNAAIEALCVLVQDTRPIELVQLCLYELEQPAEQWNHTSLTTAFGAICQDQLQAKSLLKQLLHRKADWKSLLTQHFMSEWRSGSSFFDQLSGALSPASQPLLAEWIDQLAHSLTSSLNSTSALSQSELERVLDDFCFVMKTAPHWTMSLMAAFATYTTTHFDEDPSQLIEKLLTDPYISALQLQQMILPFLSLQKGRFAHAVIAMTLHHQIFPKIWETLMACFDDDTLTQTFLSKGTLLDKVLLEHGPSLLVTRPAHILTLFSSGVSLHVDYYTTIFLAWLQSPALSYEDKPALLSRLLYQATAQPSPFFFMVFSRGIIVKNRFISSSLNWFYDALISMSKISFEDIFAPFPSLSSHSKNLITSYLETNYFIDEDQHLHGQWTPGRRILLDSVSTLSSDEPFKQKLTSTIKQHFIRIYTARQTLLQTLFSEDPELFSEPKTGLLIHAVSQDGPAWGRLTDDALTILSTNRTHGPDLLREFLKQLSLRQTEYLIFRIEQPEIVKRFMIQQLLTKDMVIETIVEGQSRTKHLLKTVIRHALASLRETSLTSSQTTLVGMHETFLLMFVQAPSIFNALVGAQKDYLKDRLFLNLDDLLELRSRLIHWLNDHTEPTLALFAEKAFSLVQQGFKLLDVLTALHSMTPLMPGGVEAFQEQLHRYLVLHHRSTLPQEMGQLGILLQLFHPGMGVGKLNEAILSEFHNADKLYRELYLNGVIDDYGQILPQSETPPYRDFFEATIPKGTAYALELEQSPTFYAKELTDFTAKLSALMKGQQTPLRLSMIELIVTFKWCSSAQKNIQSPRMILACKSFLEEALSGTLAFTSDLDRLLVVHHLFSAESGTLDTERVSLFLGNPSETLVSQLHVLNALFGALYLKNHRFTTAIMTLSSYSKQEWAFLKLYLSVEKDGASLEAHLLRRCSHLLPAKTATLNPDLFQLMAKELTPHLMRWTTQVKDAFANAAQSSSEDGVRKLLQILSALEKPLDQEGEYLI